MGPCSGAGRCRPRSLRTSRSVGEARALYDLVKLKGREGAAGIVQSEHALSRLEFVEGVARRLATRAGEVVPCATAAG